MGCTTSTSGGVAAGVTLTGLAEDVRSIMLSMPERPLRFCTMGMSNAGKSTLINTINHIFAEDGLCAGGTYVPLVATGRALSDTTAQTVRVCHVVVNYKVDANITKSFVLTDVPGFTQPGGEDDQESGTIRDTIWKAAQYYVEGLPHNYRMNLACPDEAKGKTLEYLSADAVIIVVDAAQLVGNMTPAKERHLSRFMDICNKFRELGSDTGGGYAGFAVAATHLDDAYDEIMETEREERRTSQRSMGNLAPGTNIMGLIENKRAKVTHQLCKNSTIPKEMIFAMELFTGDGKANVDGRGAMVPSFAATTLAIRQLIQCVTKQGIARAKAAKMDQDAEKVHRHVPRGVSFNPNSIELELGLALGESADANDLKNILEQS